MKAVISGFALFAFLAASTLPIQSYAQTSNSPTVAPDAGGTAPSSTKKSKGSSKSHSKKKSKKSSSSHASSGKTQHHSMNTAKHSRHSASWKRTRILTYCGRRPGAGQRQTVYLNLPAWLQPQGWRRAGTVTGQFRRVNPDEIDERKDISAHPVTLGACALAVTTGIPQCSSAR
jgi:hypothetical protein